MSFQQYRDRYMPLLEAELRGALAGGTGLPAFYGMMQYHMGWVDGTLRPVTARAGKRLRPMLCLLVCEAVGGQMEHALTAAAAIEILHNFSLVHDDIEDNSSTRRNRITVWKLWGLAHGINSGDGMFASAFLKMAELPDRGVPYRTAISAQRIFAETCLALTEGQYLDLSFETRRDVGLDDYLTMIRNKTAVLIGCSTQLGALLGQADSETVAALAQFGVNLGLAFQVTDDILGIWGHERDTGKSASSDILTKKKSLPIIHALEDPNLRAIYAQETLSVSDVDIVLEILDRCDARAFAETMAVEYSQQAMSCLAKVEAASPALEALHEYTRALLQRTA